MCKNKRNPVLEENLLPVSVVTNSKSELNYCLMGKIQFKVALGCVFYGRMSDDDEKQMRLVRTKGFVALAARCHRRPTTVRSQQLFVFSYLKYKL